jgi:hypothetical protein
VLYFFDPLTCLQILSDPVGFSHPTVNIAALEK